MRYYNVNPRYTSGSPAMVDRSTAERVVEQEKAAYNLNLKGVYGEEARQHAEKEGLHGVVELVEEQRAGRVSGWQVQDLCTGVRFWRAVKNAKPQCIDDNDHEFDLQSIAFRGIECGNLGIVAKCKLCGDKATSVKPILMHWGK